jgi:iduronate 2-sulfatase
VNSRTVLAQLTAALLWFAPAGLLAAPNVLFITIDDLRPELGCYGKSQIVSPHIDRLASRGMVFRRAYSQQALCNPSRASFLTGLRPDSTGVHDLVTHFRKKVPEVTTLPQHFKNHGYYSQTIGKIFHPAFAGFGIGSDLGDNASWSEPAWLGSPRYYYSPLGVRLAREAYTAALKAGPAGAPNWVAEVIARKSSLAPTSAAEVQDDGEEDWTKVNVRVLATEAPEVDDSVLLDGQVTDRARASLRAFKQRRDRRPFFLAVGYLRPHLPFIAPKKYWDLYDPEKITVADNPSPPHDAPALALAIPMDELRDTYPKDVRYRPQSPAEELQPYDLPRIGPLTKEQQVQLRHGYYACISFIDAQIGRLVDELERLDLAEDTIITILGDHGFSLGEHGLWGKLTNFEDATRSPLIICVPGKTEGGKQTDAVVELLDVYPTLCELAGLPLPPHLEGTSATPLLNEPHRPGKAAAFSQYPREGFTGYSMRTERYRFTKWQSAADPDVVGGVELYDHSYDPGENVNLATSTEHAGLIVELSKTLRDFTQRTAPGRDL